MVQPKELKTARRGDLVLIHKIILEPGERADNLPEVTRKVPYECWIKGFLQDDFAEVGREVHIKSFIGRELCGTLVEINPVYDHNFGEPQPELNLIGINAWKKLQEGEGYHCDEH